VLPQLTQFKRAALNLFFPQKCLGCGQEGNLLCHSCQNSLSRIMPPVCPKCGRPQPSGLLCPACIAWQSAIDGIRSPFKFDTLIREAVHQLKYKNMRSLAAPLAILIEHYLSKNPLPGQVLVPVPLHPKRLRERGFNQSELLARELGKLSHLPVSTNFLVRTRYLRPQARTKSVDDRRQNVKNAFSCTALAFPFTEVLLVDDVSTSGSTLDACAAALKYSGVLSVWGIALARDI
jgi:ComF family protein